MGFVRTEDVRGVRLDDGRVLCAEHMGELSEYKEAYLITEQNIDKEDGTFYCDECEEAL